MTPRTPRTPRPGGPGPTRRRLRPLALLAAAALALAPLTACSSSASAPHGGSPTTLPAATGSATSPAQAAPDPADARFYDQHLRWTSCGGGLQCAKASVPVDWSAPGGATLQLALDRYPAQDSAHRLGALLVDPGGPGGSGVQWLRQAGRTGVVSSAVAADYDVVGFDPRGVGASDPVDCLSDADLDTYLSEDVDPNTASGLAELTARSRQFAQGCQADAGALLAHVGTVDAARDMDVLRAVLGEAHLDYLGKSYGTLLGATYAGMFPQRVGRFVLDGDLDPASSYSDVSLLQAKGLEASLRAYAAGCATRGTCPLSHDTDTAVGQIRTLLEATHTAPLPTGTSRVLTEPLATTGVITPLYDNASWPVLDQALSEALKGNGAGLLHLADAYADRNADGTYSDNLLEAFTAINCLDYPVDAQVPYMKAEEAQLEQVSPTFGESLSFGEVQCSVWPDKPTRTPAPITAEGAPPILVVGNTGDPVTPYPWAVALAKELSSGRLLTWNGQGHTSYRRGSACIDDAVDGYLLRGVLPGKGATCRT